ncbi:MAG: single-stranded DNA-binding protein [Alphaproteobacteria bacterium]|nr:single-stranded DNA-binding protein [Alphaproteobacteria bacterium]
MTAHIAAYGRLGSDPVQRQSQAGNPWATASIAVPLGEGDGEALVQWFSVVAFGRIAETLGRHAKGDLVSVSGRLQLNRWQDRDGKDHERLQVIADAVLSAKTVHPADRRRRDGEAGQC